MSANTAQALVPKRQQIERIIAAVREADDYATIFFGSNCADLLLEYCPDAEVRSTVYGDGPDYPTAHVLTVVEARIGKTSISAHYPMRPATEAERQALRGEQASEHTSYRSAYVGGGA